MTYSFRPKELLLARTARGMTQAAAAKRLGCGLRTYVSWELRSAIPRNFWRDRLADFCKVAKEIKAHGRLQRGGISSGRSLSISSGDN